MSRRDLPSRQVITPIPNRASSTIVIASRLRIVAPSAAESLVTRSAGRTSTPRDAEPRRCEDGEHRHDRADRGRAAEERDRREPGVPRRCGSGSRAPNPPIEPGAAVEAEQPTHRRERQRLERRDAEGLRPAASSSGRKTRGWRSDQRRGTRRQERDERGVDACTHARLTTKTTTPEIAESTASTRIEASIVARRGLARQPRERRDARRRRPDTTRDVLREHRDHLRLEGGAVGNVDPQAARMRIQPRMNTR